MTLQNLIDHIPRPVRRLATGAALLTSLTFAGCDTQDPLQQDPQVDVDPLPPEDPTEDPTDDDPTPQNFTCAYNAAIPQGTIASIDRIQRLFAQHDVQLFERAEDGQLIPGQVVAGGPNRQDPNGLYGQAFNLFKFEGERHVSVQTDVYAPAEETIVDRVMDGELPPATLQPRPVTKTVTVNTERPYGYTPADLVVQVGNAQYELGTNNNGQFEFTGNGEVSTVYDYSDVSGQTIFRRADCSTDPEDITYDGELYTLHADTLGVVDPQLRIERPGENSHSLNYTSSEDGLPIGSLAISKINGGIDNMVFAVLSADLVTPDNLRARIDIYSGNGEEITDASVSLLGENNVPVESGSVQINFLVPEEYRSEIVDLQGYEAYTPEFVRGDTLR